MKAAVFHGPLDMRIENAPEPELVAGGALLCIRACAICGSDAMIYRGDHDYPHPSIIGHEAAGEVIAVADDARNVNVGDRITFWCHYGCFAEYTCLPTQQVVIGHLGESVTFEQGANTQLLCAVMRGVRCAKLQKGERVLVLGQGPVGLMALQGARADGAAKIATTDLRPNRIAMSRRLGADIALDGTAPDWPEAVRDTIGEVDVVLDCMTDDESTDRQALNQAMKCTRVGGRYVMIGMGARPRGLSALTMLSRQVTLIPTYQPMERVQEIMDQCCQWVADGTVDVTSFVTHRIQLENLAEGFEMVLNRPQEVIKVMVEI